MSTTAQWAIAGVVLLALFGYLGGRFVGDWRAWRLERARRKQLHTPSLLASDPYREHLARAIRVGSPTLVQRLEDELRAAKTVEAGTARAEQILDEHEQR